MYRFKYAAIPNLGIAEKAIMSALEEYGPTLWKRYVDDVLEKVKTGYTQQLTGHLNTIDITENIKFTHDEKQTIAFLYININDTDSGDIKIKSRRKPTHIDQYLLLFYLNISQHTN